MDVGAAVGVDVDEEGSALTAGLFVRFGWLHEPLSQMGNSFTTVRLSGA